jgi:hypothetical protein
LTVIARTSLTVLGRVSGDGIGGSGEGIELSKRSAAKIDNGAIADPIEADQLAAQGIADIPAATAPAQLTLAG